MQQNPPAVVELLRSEGAEVYLIQNNTMQPIAKGPLSLLFEQKHHWVLLKISNFTYGLSKGIPLLCSNREKGVFRTYIVPAPDGFYAIRITEVWSRNELARLDEIMKENSMFVHKEDFNAYLDSLNDKPRDTLVYQEALNYQPAYVDPNAAVQQENAGYTNDNGNKVVNENEFLNDLSNKMASLRGETIRSRNQQSTKVEYVERLRAEPEPSQQEAPAKKQKKEKKEKKEKNENGEKKEKKSIFKKMTSIFSKKKKEPQPVSNAEYVMNNNLTQQSAVDGTPVNEDLNEIKRAMATANQISTALAKESKKAAKEQGGHNIEAYERNGLWTHATIHKSFDAYNGMMNVMGQVLSAQ